MSEVSARSEPAQAAYDLKSGQFLIPTLVLRDLDTDALDAYLSHQVARMPTFFEQAPVVIDLSNLVSREPLDEFPMIIGMLRGRGMNPVGVRGASDAQKAQAAAFEMAIMPAGRTPATAPSSPTAAKPRPASQSLVVDKPVRSGQRILADAGDLVLLAGVSSGAEVLATGHIHAYGALRGRAMAGVKGDTEARIFCHEFGAELISIAGRYMVSEKLENRYLGRAVQVSLRGDALNFKLL